MRNKLEEFQKQMNETKKQLRHWQEKLSKLSLQNIRYVLNESST